jgi:hypothetical protein
MLLSFLATSTSQPVYRRAPMRTQLTKSIVFGAALLGLGGCVAAPYSPDTGYRQGYYYQEPGYYQQPAYSYQQPGYY